jgi:hypothetical protein
MRLFRKGGKLPKPVEQPAALPIATQAVASPRPSLPLITLNAEQKNILEKPLDPRVDRILQELHADRASAEEVLHSRRVIRFPQQNWAQARVIQDESGFWRIVPGPASETDEKLLDCL